MSRLDEHVASMQDAFDDNAEKMEWEMAIQSSGIKERCCKSMYLYNNNNVQSLVLRSKETTSLLTSVKKGWIRDTYTLHRLIMVVYVPTVLSGTNGYIDIDIVSEDSGQRIQLVREHSVSTAATFVSRWPRAVDAKSKGLALKISVDGINILRDARVGTLYPFWEDKISSKMVVERTLPSRVYKLEEQEPALYIRDASMLRAAMATKILTGQKGSDYTTQQPLSLQRPERLPQLPPTIPATSASTSTEGRKPRAARPRSPTVTLPDQQVTHAFAPDPTLSAS